MTRTLPLVGLIEIAMRAGVRRPVASMWRTRYPDTFPEPVAELAIGPVFWWPDVAQWLSATGRKTDADWSREDVVNQWGERTNNVSRPATRGRR